MESTSFWNPESTVLESGIQYSGSGIHSMESRIQDCPGFPYMGRLRILLYKAIIRVFGVMITIKGGPGNFF